MSDRIIKKESIVSQTKQLVEVYQYQLINHSVMGVASDKQNIPQHNERLPVRALLQQFLYSEKSKRRRSCCGRKYGYYTFDTAVTLKVSPPITIYLKLHSLFLSVEILISVDWFVNVILIF